YAGFALVDYRRLRQFSWWLYVAAVFLLLLVLVVGTPRYGARRWLTPLGAVSIQPSEFAKLAVIMALARRLARPGTDFARIGTLATILAVVGVPMFLIMKQPDLGSAMVLVPIAVLMMFIGGVPVKVLGLMFGVGVLVALLMLGALFLPERLGASPQTRETFARLTCLTSYQRSRIRVYLGLEHDPLGAGWNKLQSQIAVGSGGAWGKGFRRGTQNILGFLPRSVAPTDFIYSVIAEEKGFAGTVTIFILFAVIVVGAAQAALLTRDRWGRLLAVGVLSLIASHVVVNIAMTVGVLPITGLPLPFLSYGGSFMVVVTSGLGLVQSIYVRARPARVVTEQCEFWKLRGKT
ncbi:MAG: rod shape-determining protein RodA, partial [Kiritimatiellae bacterium]|nr:rod shape-determining protein RodA [Kiritimatiellia bacterium]